jgi:chromosome partitioning protein
MSIEFTKARTAHVVVVGNEKGGSGKSTTALHIAVALMKAGQRVATIDLDCRQQSLTRLIENRRAWGRRTGAALEVPLHRCLRMGDTPSITQNEQIELTQLMNAISNVESVCDCVVIDTPGYATYLMRLAHSLADTLVTPINDSFLDLDVLASFDPATYEVREESHYAELVRTARHSRRKFDGATIDWIVMRNRLAPLSSRNKLRVADSLNALSGQLVFRPLQGFGERVVYRDMVPRGLTALDDLNEATLGARPGQGHYTARAEVLAFLQQLRKPDGNGRPDTGSPVQLFDRDQAAYPLAC